MRAAPRPDWGGRTVVCIASGPSLTKEDCDAVRASGLTTIVTNSTFRLAPWAEIIFGFDGRWWQTHIAEIRASGFVGRTIGSGPNVIKFGVETIQGAQWLTPFTNSGASAVSIAIGGGAKRVVMLGYDCAIALDGKKHWHGDHPKGFSNCASIKKWPYQFDQLAKVARRAGVEIVNASRETALRQFRRVALSEAIPAKETETA